MHREFVMADNIFFKFNTIIIFGVDNAISISIHFLVCNFFFFYKSALVHSSSRKQVVTAVIKNKYIAIFSSNY